VRTLNRRNDRLTVAAIATCFLATIAGAPFFHVPSILVSFLPSLFLIAIAGNVFGWYALARSMRTARTDGLTGLANRHTFDTAVEAQLALAKRSQKPLAIIMIDVDWFKKYNDFYGHIAGDEALRLVAHSLGRSLPRKTDLAARYGGEEFAVVLSATDLEGARNVAQRIGDRIRALKIEHRGSEFGRVTVSLGISAYDPESLRKWPTANDLLRLADAALYQAKECGRDRAVIDIGLLFEGSGARIAERSAYEARDNREVRTQLAS
jgi:diguanylate cyclase (GGDEF)-like protein